MGRWLQGATAFEHLQTRAKCDKQPVFEAALNGLIVVLKA